MASGGSGLGASYTQPISAPAFIGSPFPTQGKVWFVKPGTGQGGSDGNNGKSPRKALKTLAKAQSLATANQNDVVYLMSGKNSSSGTTDYQSETLDWAKDGVHLIGVNSGSHMSQRSRIALISSYVTASNLFTLSANNCYIANIQTYEGVSDANPTGCMKVTGDRNMFENCHLAGIGGDANDISGAYSLFVNGAEEVRFRNCHIGLNTVSAGTAANSEILFDGAAKNILFEACTIFRRIEHATNHPLVKLADATAIDEMIQFNNCGFISTSTNYTYSQGGVFKLVADLTQGRVILNQCYAAGADKWDVDDRDKIDIIASPTPAADTAGLVRAV